MAMRISGRRAVVSALKSSRASFLRYTETNAKRFASYQVVVSKDTPNPRNFPRSGVSELEAPIVNPADKYQSKADDMHRYGSWLMGCLPKYIQQFSVWKDELVIYISPSGVIPVFSFLKCKSYCNTFQCGIFV